MVRNARHGCFSVFLLWICGLLVAGMFGCARHETPSVLPSPAQAPAVPEPVADQPAGPTGAVSAYERGLRAFEAGEMQKAGAAWRECLTMETDPAGRQRALFALAAVKLVTANTEGELTRAMDIFDTWANNAPAGGNGEDPRLLVPLVHAFRPGFALKEVKAAGDKECSKKLADREQQVRRMQQQVKALETIHREIQEKKKGLTNY
jgi:hypothetical protein